MKRVLVLLLFFFVGTLVASSSHAQNILFEEEVVDVGNLGLTVTNAGFIGRANVRNNPTGPPSMEYPLDSGAEHLFESGLWVGATRSDGVVTVRTGAITASSGYRPGGTGYEFAQAENIFEQSRLPSSDNFTRLATSHQDFTTAFVDTASVLPGTSIPMPDPSGRLGMEVIMKTYAWNFPFTEYFVILNFDIVNKSQATWDSVYVGMYHDIVTRNVNTNTEAGGAFFNKGGYGYIDSLNVSYGFNAGGSEETINTYGAMSFLGADWREPRTGQVRFFHPNVADEYIADGYTPPHVNPRWWLFSSGINEEDRPNTDEERYRRMGVPHPNPANFETEEEYRIAFLAFENRLRTDGQIAAGNWIGMTAIGPFPEVAPGDTLQVTFAAVAALKPTEFQGQSGKPVDNDDSRRLLANNTSWARRTYAGEDNNYNGRLDPGEDVNGNGKLDRYLIPEPPEAPNVRIEFSDDTNANGQQSSKVTFYWDRSAEASKDPVTGKLDFEGYRIYRTNPGDDLAGNILDAATLIAQYDKPGNRTGFNNGFKEVELAEPVLFPDDTTQYWYKFEAASLLAGWQYLFTITSFDEGDPDAGLESFESSRTANATRIFPGTPAQTAEEQRKVGVYPNPYRVNAAWDGSTSRTRRLNFFNLPPRATIRVYTLTGEVVTELQHEAASYVGDTRWYDDFSAENRILPGGEHSWDILSENSLNIAGGLYLYTVKDLDSGDVQKGKFVIIK